MTERQSLAGQVALVTGASGGSGRACARAVLCLASDDSDYVTGTTLVVDGGMMLHPGFAGGHG